MTSNSPASQQNQSAGPRLSSVRFHHPSGQANATPAINDLLRSATESLQAAACFVTRPGALVLAAHAERLRLPDSFFVASIDPPTALDALAYLHQCAAGHVFLHLGGRTPEEVRVGRSLMHSKLLLANAHDASRLWVG